MCLLIYCTTEKITNVYELICTAVCIKSEG